jgi:hypothetical protein
LGLLAAGSLLPGFQSPTTSFIFDAAVVVLLAATLGFIMGTLLLWPVLGTFIGKVNGSPFDDGDWVRILIGPYRDLFACVYDADVWRGRGQLRVRLGEEAGRGCADVFSIIQVRREDPKE